MLLTLIEDFSSQVVLDSELIGTPETGYFLNSGVHSYINLANLVSLLPKVDYTFSTYDNAATYGKFSESQQLSDIVLDSGKIYQSIQASNTGNAVSDEDFWLETTQEALRIKTFFYRSYRMALQKLNLTRRLLDNQYLYNLVELNRNETETALSGDYAGWCFEPKGSDYVSIRINEMSLQAKTATPQSVYVVNQGQLVTTLTVNPNADGRLVFEDVGYTVSGKGVFYFLVDAQTVLTNGAVVDPLKFNGFTAYTCIGIGATPEGSEYSYNTSNNGLGFNISASFDGGKYVENNKVDFGRYFQAAWQLDVLNCFLYNAYNRSNRDERNVIDKQLLINETKVTNAETAVKHFNQELKKAISVIERSFDTELSEGNTDEIEIETGSV